MQFGGVDYVAVLAAAVLAFAFGAVYYGVLSKPWVRATRRAPEDVKMSFSPLVVTFLCELVMAWVIAGVIGHLGEGQVTFSNGVVSAFFLWLGLMATVTVVNQRYEGFGWDLSIIDSLHWLGVALIMGAVIGWWGI